MENIKNVKKRKKRDLNKKRKNVYYIYDENRLSQGNRGMRQQIA